MDDRVLSSLYDIRGCLNDIARYVGKRSKADYDSDDMLRAAVERKYLIIGEALNRIRKADLLVYMKIRESDKIVSFRNVLAHGYDVVNDDISWMIICDKIPLLKDDVNTLIGLL